MGKILLSIENVFPAEKMSSKEHVTPGSYNIVCSTTFDGRYDMSHVPEESSLSAQTGIGYVSSTLIRTDQQSSITASDLYQEVSLMNKRYTINNVPIRYVTKTTNETKTLICIPQGTFGFKVPLCDTYVTPQHKIYTPVYTTPGSIPVLMKAKLLYRYFPQVRSVVRNTKDVLFNILLPHHGIVHIHNMPSESLNPNDLHVETLVKKGIL